MDQSAFVKDLIFSDHRFWEGSEVLIRIGNSHYECLVLEEIEVICHRNRANVIFLNLTIPEEGFVKTVYNSHHLCDASSDDN